MKESYVRTILSDFPYPVSKQFIKLRTDECLEPGPLRLKYILTTGEAISRLLGIIVLCACRELLEKRKVFFSKGFCEEFRRQFPRPSWGFWTFMIREGLKFLERNKSLNTVPELRAFYFGKNRRAERSGAAQALEKLLTIRNGLNHDRIKAMRNHDFRRLCEESFPLLCLALKAADFLLNYKMTFFSQIEVDKKRRRPPEFIHRFKRISGISDDFFGGKERFDHTQDSRVIILLTPDDRERRDLSLDPLYVYEEEAGEAPDIYFYNGMTKPDLAVYASCNRRGRFIAKQSTRAEIVTAELAHIKEIFVRYNQTVEKSKEDI
jgi:hypothetical protein